MSVMLGGIAVDAVVKILQKEIAKGGRLSDFNGRAYKYEKPQTKGQSDMTENAEYISVNHLPFVHRGAIGEGVVNINVHVPETKTHEPNTKRLDALTSHIAELFPEDTYIAPAYYSFLADSRPTPDSDKTYYINIQLNVRFNNLNK